MRIRGDKGRGGVIERDPFLKIGKISLISEKNALVVFVYGLNVSFEMQFQEKLGEQTSKVFPCTVFLWCTTDKMFIEVPSFQEPLPAGKNSWLRVSKIFYKG